MTIQYQTPPINLDGDGKVCTRCNQKTLVYNGVEQWRHSNVSGNLLCKRCYDEEYRNKHKEIYVSNLEINKRQKAEFAAIHHHHLLLILSATLLQIRQLITADK